jgi:pyridinium-3,5-bisthiocarboxylic acid mononucleotide nickel chelatase
MKIAYFDTIGGISGDMTLAACISAGVRLDELTKEIDKLQLKGIEIKSFQVSYHGVNAVRVEVVSNEKHHHRGLQEINKIIDESNLRSEIKNKSKKIFFTLAQAEATVHRVPIEKIHFHEVGAIDSIVDIVGAVICLDKLGVQSVYSSPLKLGSGGFVQSEHGNLPIPAPATIEVLKNYPITFTILQYELTTPTGAAIIKSLSSGMLDSKKMITDVIGYGAGARELKEIPNLLRLVVGEIDERYDEEIIILEANIDNMNPEIYPYVIEMLMSAGALDAYLIPVIMKKGRPANILSAICDRSKLEELKKIFLTETTTLGVRISVSQRFKVERCEEKIETSFGSVKVKISKIDENKRIMPEFEECRRIAQKYNLPLIEVYKIINKEIH